MAGRIDGLIGRRSLYGPCPTLPFPPARGAYRRGLSRVGMAGTTRMPCQAVGGVFACQKAFGRPDAQVQPVGVTEPSGFGAAASWTANPRICGFTGSTAGAQMAIQRFPFGQVPLMPSAVRVG